MTSGGIRVDVGNVSNVIDSGDAANYYGYGVGMTGFVDNSTGMGLPAQGFGTQASVGRRSTVQIAHKHCQAALFGW